MANLITSVPAIETPTWEVYFKPLLNDPLINKLPFDLSIGNMPKDIFFNGNADKITGAGSTCGWSVKGDGLAFTKKTLDPVELKAAVNQCYSVLLKKLFGDKLPDGAMRGELSNEVISFMTTQQAYAFNRDLLSILFLGDTGATPDDYYSLLDGIYTKLLAGVAANDGTVDGGAIVAGDVDAGSFYGTMNTIYNLQPRQLKGIDNNSKVWIWTQALYDAYLNYLETSTQGTAGVIQTQYVTDGLSATKFKGIPIVVTPIVDERLETDFLSGSPAAATDPYRVILTNPKNHIIMLDGNGFANADVFHQKKEDLVWAVGSCLMDYQYGYGDQNVIAGF
jgi:hypothetical protein